MNKNTEANGEMQWFCKVYTILSKINWDSEEIVGGKSPEFKHYNNY